MRAINKNKGIALIAVILVMALLIITALSLTTFVVERLRLVSVRENEIKAYYMAQTGIHYGIWIYITNGTRSGTVNYYPDRYFTWNTTVSGPNLTVTSTGYSPKTSTKQIKKTIIANYNNSKKRLTGMTMQ